MATQIKDAYQGSEYFGISRRSPFVVDYKDRLGNWHRSSFENAPNWEYWVILPEDLRQLILSKISH